MKSVFIAAIVLLQIGVRAQQNPVSGIVLEETLKGRTRPIANASVNWLNTTVGTFTDSSGAYVLPAVSETNRLVISFLGFVPDTITVVSSIKITTILKSATNLKEVTVEYRQKSTSISRINPIKVQQIGKKELFKAACCNLSESFETNPSVDVAFTDAVSGAKQIQLLGLAGPYTQITVENVPAIRGLSSVYGLGQIPGTWIEGMQLSKGTGSVINGYESIAGQLNVELVKPTAQEKVILNGYAAQGGRLETNVVINQPVTSKLSTGLLMHASGRVQETDQNKDGFSDNPTGSNYNLINRWDYRTEKGFESQFGVGILAEDKEGGQLSSSQLPERYVFSVSNRQYEVFAKTGFVFPEKEFQSIGLQFSAKQFEQRSRFGSLNSYAGDQSTFYVNLIYQNIIGTSDHKFRTGLSYIDDQYSEGFEINQNNTFPSLTNTLYLRAEKVPGAFFEYTWTPLETFSVVGGLRADAHNIYGTFYTPRLHLRYEIAPKKVIRFSGGRGRKTANILAENNGLMASSRNWIIQSTNRQLPYGLEQEDAWNFGLNYTHNFELDYREGSFSVDFYRTDFVNQVVVDLDNSANQALFYNLQGKSFANSLQLELEYEVLKHLDVRMAYRLYDVQVQYTRYQAQRPLLSRNRAFLNVAYETQSNWVFDATLNWVGRKRLPFTGDNPAEFRLAEYSPNYFLLNAQATKKVGDKFEAYLGIENITNFKQTQAIVAANEPNGKYFDSSMIWGPVFGRIVYVGFRYTLKREG